MFLPNNFRLEKNFTVNEFLSSVDIAMPTYENISNVTKLAQHLQKFRDAVKLEVRITSGVRSERYNEIIGGSKNSYHISGLAADFELIKRINGKVIEWYGDWTIDTFLPIFELCGFSNVGFYRKNGKFQWIHADIGTPWKDGTAGTWRKYSDTLSYQIVEV